jgi:hypothetical protein
MTALAQAQVPGSGSTALDFVNTAQQRANGGTGSSGSCCRPFMDF